MTYISEININDYDYNLPEEKIAKYPLPNRDESKLLIFNNDIKSDIFKNVDKYLDNTKLIFLNNTKVINARLIFTKETGSQIEVFCLEPYEPTDYAISLNSTKKCTWKCFVGNNKKWKSGKLYQKLELDDKIISLSCEKLEKCDNSFIISFEWDDNSILFSQILEKAGKIPVPPYLNRSSEDIDYKRYQTIFGEFPGSVAAPTAGLHFTEEVFRKLSNKNIQRDYLTLHVGAGTFKPVKSKKISEHTMHTEHFIITKENVKNLIELHENLCIVGTTTVRAIESFYYVLIKINKYKKIDNSFYIGQWDPYILDNENNVPKITTLLENCLNLMNRQKIENIYCSTQIMILPRYKFKFTKRLITNFHQPKSTLLLLVSALVGEKWKEIYEYAIKNDFRFLSYGDSCLLTSSE